MIVVSASAVESPSANEAEIYTYLTSEMGLNTAAACGIMANIYYETNFTADISVSGYYGLFMYWSGLANELFTWCGNNGYDYTTVHGQMKFFDYKMESAYQSLLGTLRGLSNTADSAYSAADMFCRQFERPANASYEANKRGVYASGTLFPKYANGTGRRFRRSSRDAGQLYRLRHRRCAERTHRPRHRIQHCQFLLYGSSVSVVAESDGWCKLSSGNWVSGTYLSTTPVSSNGSNDVGSTYYVTASALNVRSSAGTDSSIISCLYNGSSITIVAEEIDSSGSTWCQLSSGGWVSKEYLSASATSGSGSSGSSSNATHYVTASALNVRSDAGTDSSVISCLYNGSGVSVVAEDTDSNGDVWCQLSSGGWVSKEYLSTSPSGGSSGSTYEVTASALNVRSGAGMANTVINCLWKGSEVTIVDTAYDADGQSWGQLSSGGWVSMEYLA